MWCSEPPVRRRQATYAAASSLARCASSFCVLAVCWLSRRESCAFTASSTSGGKSACSSKGAGPALATPSEGVVSPSVAGGASGSGAAREEEDDLAHAPVAQKHQEKVSRRRIVDVLALLRDFGPLLFPAPGGRPTPSWGSPKYASNRFRQP